MAKGHGNLLSREAFLSASKLRTKVVEIPDVGTVMVRELSTAQRKEYLQYLEVDKDNKPQFSLDKQVEFNKFVISLSVINEDGSRMFANMADVPELRQDAVDLIVRTVLELSGIVMAETVPLAETPKRTSATP